MVHRHKSATMAMAPLTCVSASSYGASSSACQRCTSHLHPLLVSVVRAAMSGLPPALPWGHVSPAKPAPKRARVEGGLERVGNAQAASAVAAPQPRAARKAEELGLQLGDRIEVRRGTLFARKGEEERASVLLRCVLKRGVACVRARWRGTSRTKRLASRTLGCAQHSTARKNSLSHSRPSRACAPNAPPNARPARSGAARRWRRWRASSPVTRRVIAKTDNPTLSRHPSHTHAPHCAAAL